MLEPEHELVTITEARAILGGSRPVSRATVYARIAAGLPVVRHGRILRFRRADLLRLVLGATERHAPCHRGRRGKLS